MQRILELIECIRDIGKMTNRMEEGKNIMKKKKNTFMDIGRMESLFKD